MTDRRDTTSAAFFDAIYRNSDDPWNFETNPEEQARYKAILRSLPDRIFRRVFEPGCSIGVLTQRLAEHCNQLEAIDISSEAIALARRRCSYLANVHIRQASLPWYWPNGTFDLIVFSEIGYYFEADDLASVCCRLVDLLESGGTLVAGHWRGSSADHILDGKTVHEIISKTPGLRSSLFEQHPGFLLQRWDRLPEENV